MAGIPGNPADGNVKTVLLPAGTIADLDAPTATELNDVSGVDISCYLTAGGWDQTTDQAVIDDERECDTTTRQEPGRKTHSLTITGIDNTNTPDEATDNKLVDTLVEGVEVVAVRRWGKAYDTAFATGDRVRVIVFKPGFRQEVTYESNTMQRSMWPTFVTDVRDVEVVAGP